MSAQEPFSAPRKILVVDDDKIILKTLSFKLTKEGYQVFTADEGGQAIRLVRDQHPDLILLDINFPPDVGAGGGVGWDGFRILEWLHHMDNSRVAPVIIISSADGARYHDRVLAIGARGFFHKPLDYESLFDAIRALLEEDGVGCSTVVANDFEV
jgi:DNA-binding response OmpR family regulator